MTEPRAPTADEPTVRESGPSFGVTDPEDASLPDDSLRLPARFRVVAQRGAGGMGAVYEAHDSLLERRVAIKRLHGSAMGDARHRARLLREARALAALRHPNVVAIYDVLEHEGTVVIVMELVEGDDLRHWLGRRERGLEEIVDVFVQSGRGLAAAHAADVLHRDFKPANVLVGDDGRARVLDFGIARVGPRDPEETSYSIDPGGTGSASGVVDPTLTPRGVIMGTPKYMAPEQLSGTTTAAADQFSLCVSLWQAVTGSRPYAGRATFDALRDVPRRPSGIRPGSARARVLAVAHRGLSPMPKHRWPSMTELVEALERAVAPRRGRTAGLLGGAAVLLAVGTWTLAPADRRERCLRGAEEASSLWDAATQQRVRAGLDAVDASSTARVWAAVDDELEGAVGRWTQARRGICDEPDAPAFDTRMRCLDEARELIAATVDLLADADPRTVARARHAVEALHPVPHCDDPEALGDLGSSPTDPDTALAIHRVRLRRVRALALSNAGHYGESAEQLEALAAEAEALDVAGLHADLLARAGYNHRRSGDLDVAIEQLTSAYWEASEANAGRVAAYCTWNLAIALSEQPGRTDESEEWIRHGFAAIERWDLHEHMQGHMHNTHGILLERFGRHEEAKAALLEALRLRRDHPDEPGPIGETYINLGNTSESLGELEDGAEYFRRAIDPLVEARGPHHPNVGAAHQGLGMILVQAGEHQRARQELRRAIEIFVPTLGDNHPDVAVALINLGSAELALGNAEQAAAHQQRALEILATALPEEHPLIAIATANLAQAELALGDLDRARAHAQRSMEIHAAATGDDGLQATLQRGRLGAIVRRQGDPVRALELLRRARSHADEMLPCTHPERSWLELELGQAAAASGSRDDARRAIEAALVCASQAEGDTREVQLEAHLGLARLSRDDGDLPRARDELRAARILASDLGDSHLSAQVEQVALTLADRR